MSDTGQQVAAILSFVYDQYNSSACKRRRVEANASSLRAAT